MKTAQFLLKTEIGPLHLVASEKGLCGIFWKKQTAPLASSLRGKEPQIAHLARAAQQIEEYFKGKRRQFDLSFDIQGTDFQKRVWNQLAKIPYGETCSYRDIARRIKNAKAVRAVGTANGRNPLSIIVPCHRVIAADGSLGGYAGGLSIKKKLLHLENSLEA